MLRNRNLLAAVAVSALICCRGEPQFAVPNTVSPDVIDQQGTAPAPESVGVATMLDDHTIVLELRADFSSGRMAEGRFIYPPSHPQYLEILKHLGGLEPKQSKPVPPF